MRLALSISLFFLVPSLFSQTSQETASGKYGDLLYGSVYQFRYYGAHQHPFFLSDRPWKSTLIYKGSRHDSVGLLYDLHKQEIVLFQDRVHALPRYICLNSTYIEEWRFVGENGEKYLFRPLLSYSHILSDPAILYRMHYEGDIRFFSSAKKEYHLDPYGTESEMEREIRYYLIKDQKLYEIRNRRSFLKAFKEEKDLLREYIRQQNLTIRTSHVPDIVRLIRFYENNLSQIHEQE